MKLDLLEEEELLKKRNRIKRLTPKKHKVVHESGRSTKTLWTKILYDLNKNGKK